MSTTKTEKVMHWWEVLKTNRQSIFPKTSEVWMFNGFSSPKSIGVFVVFFGMYMSIMYTFQGIGFGIVTWRPADMLIMLCVLFGYPAAWGVSAGTFFFSGLFGYGWLDGIKSLCMFMISYPVIIELYKKIDPKVQSLWKLLIVGALFNVFTVTWVGWYLWIMGFIPGEAFLPALGVFWVGTGPGAMFNRLIMTPIFVVALKRAGAHFLPMREEG